MPLTSPKTWSKHHGSRQQAMDRMIDQKKKKGADAILTVRFTTSMLQQGASEIFIYGTAVKLA